MTSLHWLVVWLALLAMLLTVAVYVIQKVRAEALQHEPRGSELLTKFREMHGQGVLDDEEYREIKTALAPQIKDELKDNGEKG